jgi:hypothetical protein
MRRGCTGLHRVARRGVQPLRAPAAAAAGALRARASRGLRDPPRHIYCAPALVPDVGHAEPQVRAALRHVHAVRGRTAAQSVRAPGALQHRRCHHYHYSIDELLFISVLLSSTFVYATSPLLVFFLFQSMWYIPSIRNFASMTNTVIAC